ncbi:MAG: DUF5050 domain-containing protein [Candidatus Eisenbacteria bacterium]|uniref:DUF5050 domain-containing protein n=1 Tax=Eiseniibacteriota bacterium TaxID=2212470 RepID=A0A7Y2ECW1_UNCEI|nr:DUF5050 domain-containing protein [Candidatus Eisenbacteria bacterium]
MKLRLLFSIWAIAFLLTAQATAGSRIYYLDDGTADVVSRMRTDGTGTTDIANISTNGEGVAVDGEANTVYWVEANTIYRCDTDGNNQITIASGQTGANGVEVSPEEGYVYWTRASADQVWRANLDGTGATLVLTVNDAKDVAVDPAGNHIYVSSQADGTVTRANLDGTGATIFLSGIIVTGIAVDSSTGLFYWCAPSSGAIMRCDSAGSNIVTLVSGLSLPGFVVVDDVDDKLYWTEEGGDRISTADLDGSNEETILLGLSNPDGIAIDNSITKVYTHQAGDPIGDLAALKPGDELHLLPGTFQLDDVSVGAGVEIIGAGNPEDIIIETGFGSDSFSFSSSSGHDGSIESLTMTGGEKGITAVNSSPNIKNCIFRGLRKANAPQFVSAFGIRAQGSEDILIEGCQFIGSPDGAIFLSGATATIRSCTIVGSRVYAIYVNSSSTANVERCIIANNSFGTSLCFAPSVGNFSCNLIYGNGNDDICGNDLGGNFIADPEFCDFNASDLSLKSTSPALPYQHPSSACEEDLIGAVGEGCVPPSITSISDVGNDQGGQVRISFDAASWDSPRDNPVVAYEVYREIDANNDKPTVLRGALMTQGWEFVTEVPAHQELEYSLIAATLADSTSGNTHLSNFFVRARTQDPGTYFDSSTASGYSVDNLAPGAPGGLQFAPPYLLAWEEAPEEDHACFNVYGSTIPIFDPSAVLIGSTTDPSYDTNGNLYTYYFVTSKDFAGNESLPAATNRVGVFDPDIAPSVTALHGARPNPMSSQTLIRFDLAQDSPVSLVVYGLRGEKVRTLASAFYRAGEHRSSWDGRNDQGVAVAPGMYFFKLTATGHQSHGKVVIFR